MIDVTVFRHEFPGGILAWESRDVEVLQHPQTVILWIDMGGELPVRIEMPRRKAEALALSILRQR